MIAPKLSHKNFCSILALNDGNTLLKRGVGVSIMVGLKHYEKEGNDETDRNHDKLP